MFTIRRDRHHTLTHGATAVLTALAVAACGGAEVELPGGQQPAPPEPADITVSTSTAAPGSSIRVQAAGFAPRSTVEIGIGQPQSEYSVIREATTDAEGRIETSVEVPTWTTRGQSYVVVVTEPDHDPRLVSDPFVVGEPGDRVEIHGEVTNEGVECPALRGPLGTLYTLTVTDFDYAVGTELMVKGTIAGATTCMQGTTINVESIEAHGG